MAAFLFGVVVGWVSTFAMWFIWSFGWISGLFGGCHNWRCCGVCGPDFAMGASGYEKIAEPW